MSFVIISGEFCILSRTSNEPSFWKHRTQGTGHRTQDTGGLNWIGEEIRDDTMLQWFPQIGMHSIHDDQIQDRSQQSDYQR